MQLFLLCACGLVGASAQEVVQVDAKTIQQHIDHRTFPVYPPPAKAANIQGTVVFDVTVGATGKIESMNVVSGPPLLRQAAIDCLKQWTFHPFEKDGTPVIAAGPVSLTFALSGGINATIGHSPQTKAQSETTAVNENSDDAPLETEEDPSSEPDWICNKGILSMRFSEAEVSACNQAAMQAELDGNDVAKSEAFVPAATAYAAVGDFKNALSWAEKAVEAVEHGHDNDLGSSEAYSIKGEIEGLMGDLPAADRDLTAAENFSRKEIAWAEKEQPGWKSELVRPLVRDLLSHAKVLQGLNRPDDAQKKLDEAKKY
jgi:TonB family protein